MTSTAPIPNQLWCANFSYVPTWKGMVYVAFVFRCVLPRRILGWWAATSMTTDLVLDILDMALWTAQRTATTTCPAWCITPMPAEPVYRVH